MKNNIYVLPLILVLAYCLFVYNNFIRDSSLKLFLAILIVIVSIIIFIKKYKSGLTDKKRIFVFVLAILSTTFFFAYYYNKIKWYILFVMFFCY